MRKPIKNIVDGIITSIIGTVVMVMTVIMLWTKQMSFMWEGVLGLVAGCLLLIAPKSIERIVIAGVKEGLKKCGVGGTDTKPDNPDV